MAPWSSEIMDCFQTIRPDLESDFTPAAYNKLLNTLFPVNTPYTVFPQVHRHEDGVNPTARTTFTVYYNNTPVFLLDLHAYPTLSRISSREAADDHMRVHLRDLMPYCPLESMQAVSVFGTRMAFYKVTTGQAILPARALSVGQHEDTTPADWWDCDLMEDDGAIRLKEVVNRIRNQCENL